MKKNGVTVRSYTVEDYYNKLIVSKNLKLSSQAFFLIELGCHFIGICVILQISLDTTDRSITESFMATYLVAIILSIFSWLCARYFRANVHELGHAPESSEVEENECKLREICKLSTCCGLLNCCGIPQCIFGKLHLSFSLNIAFFTSLAALLVVSLVPNMSEQSMESNLEQLMHNKSMKSLQNLSNKLKELTNLMNGIEICQASTGSEGGKTAWQKLLELKDFNGIDNLNAEQIQNHLKFINEIEVNYNTSIDGAIKLLGEIHDMNDHNKTRFEKLHLRMNLGSIFCTVIIFIRFADMTIMVLVLNLLHDKQSAKKADEDPESPEPSNSEAISYHNDLISSPTSRSPSDDRYRTPESSSSEVEPVSKSLTMI